ncbi:YHYH protein [Candidatus Marifrigoribacter sp. Uisw_064]|uniref:YHYH protein n=1 Tax=Candidatus Marifrigoribacter sp. Uisw_064 TaxID=3230970 RepID=UPI003D4253B9
MKKNIFTIYLLFGTIIISQAQLNPAITSFLQNTTETGSYYMAGNSTAINNNILVNCQQVEYSDDFVYISATGVPAYPTGPFLDGNPSQSQNQNAIFKLPLDPQENEGAPDNTVPGNIGVFVNGVSLFDYRDGVAWNTNTNSLCGGPGNPPCPGGPGAQQDWNRDAIPAEMAGFDCSKGHPAMGNYHHHQNPSAFKLDLEIVSDICNLYDADGLYFINDNEHSPLLGFAFDGFPIYGAYGYANEDGSGGIVRIKSGYQLRSITLRTHHADGTNVDDGPPVDATYFLGYFREDYEYVENTQEDYLDEHNGRMIMTPEYPDGTYAYFATVDDNWNSVYPYAVGPTFYGNYENRIVNSINESTIIYEEELGVSETIFNELNITIFPNPAADLIAVQLGSLVFDELQVELFDISGKLIKSTNIKKGSTIAYFDVQTVYEGVYLVKISNNKKSVIKKVIIKRE